MPKLYDYDEVKQKKIARDAIKKSAKKTGLRSGFVPCTKCEHGTIRYRLVGPYHVCAKCSTEGCIDFEEKQYAYTLG